MLLVTIGSLAGKNSYRKIHRWAEYNETRLKKYLKLKGGIPSLPTISRIMGDIDQEMLIDIFTSWMSTIINTRGRHIAIDGKGVRAAALKVSGERTKYILNAIDTESCLVVGERFIPDKTNEMTNIPELLRTLNIKDSMITIDAIGTTAPIISRIREMGAHFLLQVKKNNPVLYKEISDFFELLNTEKEKDAIKFDKKYADIYDKYSTYERNRDRDEYRATEIYSGEEIKGFKEIKANIGCVGQMRQTRILVVRDENGTDITPSREKFIKEGSCRQPDKPSESDDADSPRQRIGLISDVVMSAKEMARTKRKQWVIENSLHGILDNTYGEDRSTIRRGLVGMTVIRKIAYNVVRLFMQDSGIKEFQPAYDKVTFDWESVMRYIFEPVPVV